MTPSPCLRIYLSFLNTKNEKRHLDSNALTTLPEGIFDSLEALTEL